MCSYSLLSPKDEFRRHLIDTYVEFRDDVAKSFADGKECEGSFIVCFGQSLMLDEKESNPSSAGYKVILPASLSVCCSFFVQGDARCSVLQ